MARCSGGAAHRERWRVGRLLHPAFLEAVLGEPRLTEVWSVRLIVRILVTVQRKAKDASARARDGVQDRLSRQAVVLELQRRPFGHGVPPDHSVGEHARGILHRLARRPSILGLIRLSKPRVEQEHAHGAVDVRPAAVVLALGNLRLQEIARAERKDGLHGGPILLVVKVEEGRAQPRHVLQMLPAGNVHVEMQRLLVIQQLAAQTPEKVHGALTCEHP